MFQNFIISLEAVGPMFLIMAAGIFVRRKRFLDEHEIKKVNRLIFNVCFPAHMFCNLYGATIGEAFDIKLIGYCVGMILLFFFGAMAAVVKIEPSNRSRGAMIQAIYRSNFIIMGLPIVANIFGKDQMAVTTAAITIVVPLFNILAVVVLELFRGSKPNLKQMFLGIAKNPPIVGSVFGILLTVLHIQLPTFLENTLSSVGSAATPMALLILGMSLNLESLQSRRRNLLICVAGRLLIVPAIGLTGAALLGFRGVEFVTLIAVFASPTAVASFTMAEQMDSDGELAGNAVVISSAAASLTLFGWIFISKSLGIF